MTIQIEDITNGEHEGRGVYDELMRTAKAHLVKEFEAGRISSNEYSQVYLGAMQSSLQAAMQFTLGAGIASRQEELLSSQELQVRQETLVVAQQLQNLQKQEALMDSQLLQAAEELAVTKNKNLGILAETAKTKVETQVAEKQLIVMAQDIIDKAAKTELVQANTATEVVKKATMVKQQAKMDQEIALLLQKQRTEEAQILDTVNGLPVTGVIGQQKTLYAAQEKGFLRDGEQKLLKFMTDNWGLRLNSDPLTSLPTGFSNAEINKVLAKAKAGVGIT